MKLRNLFVMVMVLLGSFVFAACGQKKHEEPNEKNDYSITYVAKYGEYEFSRVAKTQEKTKNITTCAEDIVGYKFVSWSDGVETKDRTDTTDKAGQVLVAQYEMELLDVPVFVINTENNIAVTSKEDYVNCNIDLINTKEEYQLNNVGAGIRGRGNSTWQFDKKPYRIKFDSKQSLFGSSYKQKSWTLIANHVDKSLSRNALAYEMGKQFENIEFTTMHEFVELYLNNEYLGVYLLCDQIQTGSGRVDVSEDFCNDGDTGYLIELDGYISTEKDKEKDVDYFTVSDNDYGLKTPDTEDDEYDAEIYITFIKKYFENSLNAIKNGSWADVQTYIDVDSFVDVYIIQELFYNPDCGFSSFYFYKEKGGILYCGPLWDFDLSVSIGTFSQINNENILETSADTPAIGIHNVWFINLLKHEEFKSLVKERLKVYETKIKTVINLVNPINENSYYQQYSQALERNFKKWDILNNRVWIETDILMKLNSVESQMLYVRDWLLTRYYFMCDTFDVE